MTWSILLCYIIYSKPNRIKVSLVNLGPTFMEYYYLMKILFWINHMLFTKIAMATQAILLNKGYDFNKKLCPNILNINFFKNG